MNRRRFLERTSGGAAIAAGGRPRILYTSVGQPQPEQWVAVPKNDDLFSWRNFRAIRFSRRRLASPVRSANGAIRSCFGGGATYMVRGGGTAAGRAQVQLYRAAKSDFTEW